MRIGLALGLGAPRALAAESAFTGWTFINLHHYFIDSVTWRRENPETRRHLFGAVAR